MRPILLAALLATAALSAQQRGSPTRVSQRVGVEPPAVNVTTLGPKVGETVPDFAAPDQDGTTRKLSALLGPQGALVVFYRSADW